MKVGIVNVMPVSDGGKKVWSVKIKNRYWHFQKAGKRNKRKLFHVSVFILPTIEKKKKKTYSAKVDMTLENEIK